MEEHHLHHKKKEKKKEKLIYVYLDHSHSFMMLILLCAKQISNWGYAQQGTSYDFICISQFYAAS